MNSFYPSQQPGTLYIITASYMCERFGHYMLRTLLVLYIIQKLLLPTEHAYSTFAAFSALMYVAPLLGGKFIDRNFEHDQATLAGGLLLAAGLFCIGAGGQHFLNVALSLIICGNGFYAPGIIASLGQVYHHNDSRRERGFLVMYSAINLSAMGASLSAPAIIWYTGWQGAFYAAASVTMLGTVMIYLIRWYTGSLKKIPAQQFLEFAVFLLAGIAVFTLLMHSITMSVTFMILLGGLLFIYTLASLYGVKAMQRSSLYLCLGLTTFSVICFTLIQQSAMSLIVFAENNVIRTFMGYPIPTFYFMAFNPLFIILLSPFLSALWRKLDQTNSNLSISEKFALGTIFLGIGFLILTIGIEYSHAQNGKINFSWMIASYFFQTLGELFICPIGFAMITEMAPRQMVGFMIGTWYFMIAIANWLSGIVANHTVMLKHPVAHHHSSIVMTAYANVFGSLGLIAVTSGLLLLLLSNIFNRSTLQAQT